MEKMLIVDVQKVGKMCKAHRQTKTSYKQKDVALQVGYSTETISAFETGRNDSMKILMWYLYHGLTMEELERVGGVKWLR